MSRLRRWLHWQVWGEPARRLRRRRPRRGPARDPEYRAWIRTLPSAVSGQMGCEAAHTGHDGGMGQKSSDLSCVPLTPTEHLEYHRIGRRRFEVRYYIDFDVVAEGLNTEYWERQTK